MYIQVPLVIGGVVYREIFKQENSKQQITGVSSPVGDQSSNSRVSEAVDSAVV
jgi:hypothetical protein